MSDDPFYVIRPLVQWTDPVTPNRTNAAVFKASWADTLKQLRYEIDRIDGEPPIVFQIDVQESDIRRDGMLRVNAKVGHPGVVVTFQSKFGPLRYATDAYERQGYGKLQSWQANIRAIVLALESLRAVDRYGVTKRGEQYTGWRAITSGTGLFTTSAEAREWMRQVYLADTGREADQSDQDLYRLLAKRHHPDVTEDPDREIWDRLEAAARFLNVGAQNLSGTEIGCG
jgi:hypothetical protein